MRSRAHLGHRHLAQNLPVLVLENSPLGCGLLLAPCVLCVEREQHGLVLLLKGGQLCLEVVPLIHNISKPSKK